MIGHLSGNANILDLDYLRNWSLFLDFLILFKTIGVNINDKNAY
jgi:lipopolysaccharide/colanic/teichoic acid biosynthesis glycosyltransferase